MKLYSVNDYLNYIAEYYDSWIIANEFSIDTLKEIVEHADDSIKPGIQEAIDNYALLTSDEYVK